MLTRQSFADRFGCKAVLGMVHLRPLPGAPLFGESLDAVIDAALADARAIVDGGGDGILFENFGDRPFRKAGVAAITIAAMTRVIAEVVRGVALPFGVNVLRNDARAALAIAAATGAAFIRVNVHCGVMFTDQGMIEGDAAETLRLREAIAPDVAIFADHFVKHAVPPAGIDAAQAAKDLRHRGLADAVLVSGAETGAAPDAEQLRVVREAIGDAPILVGSGLSAANAKAFADADGAIVGTAIKREGRVDEPVERQRVERLVAAFKALAAR
jgi:membrane complex biogenesis BtpA family protein